MKVKELLPGTRFKFKNGKANIQSGASIRRESAPKPHATYKVGTRIKL